MIIGPPPKFHGTRDILQLADRLNRKLTLPDDVKHVLGN